ncbi:MAG: ArnT family glycosyltransferase [Pyrinomonadaceae bacterium]
MPKFQSTTAEDARSLNDKVLFAIARAGNGAHDQFAEMDQASRRKTSFAVNRNLMKQIKGPIFWLVLAFLIRLLFIWCFDYVISPDGVGYVTLARNLTSGNLRDGLSTYAPPLYPLLIGLASLFFRDGEFAGRLVSVVAGSVLIIPVYRFAEEWYGVSVARVVIAIVALHPLLIYYSTTLLTESTYTLLFTGAVFAGWSALSKGGRKSSLLCGLLFGACYLLKPEAALFLAVPFLALVVRTIMVKPRSVKPAMQNGLLLLVGFLLLASPYLLYLRKQTGAWTLSGKVSGHLWQGARRAGGDFTPLISPLLPGWTTAIVQLTKALRFEFELLNLLLPATFVVLAAAGLFRSPWTRERAGRELYLFLFVIAAVLGYAITLPNIRFLMPLLPLLLLWVAKGVAELETWIRETLTLSNTSDWPGRKSIRLLCRRFVVPVVIGILLISVVPLFVYLMRGDKWSDYYGQKRAALWIKTHDASPQPVVMSTVPVAAFYAGARHVQLVDEDYAGFIERARSSGANHILVNERDFRYLSLLRPLLDEQTVHPGLRLDYRLAEGTDHKILLYALDQTSTSMDPGQAGKTP